MEHYKYNLLSQTSRHPKMVKAEKEIGVHMRILHFAPARSSGIANVCPMASKGCEAACLNYSGHLTNRKFNARAEKTKFFFDNRALFMNKLAREIYSARRFAERKGLICGIRLNGTSDIRWETIRNKHGENIMDIFPDVAFHDYTKIANRRNLPPNYRLTFSRSESNDNDCYEALKNGMNVAVVFGLDQLPKKFMGLRVIDGDVHDWRYGDYDQYPDERVIVGLTVKGKRGRDDQSGFVFRH